MKTFFKDKLFHLYICLLVSAHFSPLILHFQALFQRQDEHQLTAKAVKTTMRFENGQQKPSEEQPYSPAQQSSQGI